MTKVFWLEKKEWRSGHVVGYNTIDNEEYALVEVRELAPKKSPVPMVIKVLTANLIEFQDKYQVGHKVLFRRPGGHSTGEIIATARKTLFIIKEGKKQHVVSYPEIIMRK